MTKRICIIHSFILYISSIEIIFGEEILLQNILIYDNYSRYFPRYNRLRVSLQI